MSEEEIKHKCYYDLNSLFHPCTGMNIMLDNSKEIELPLIISFVGVNAGKERHAFVAWKGNKKNKVKGISFNICPFCGEKILNDERLLCTDKIPLYSKIEKIEKELGLEEK